MEIEIDHLKGGSEGCLLEGPVAEENVYCAKLGAIAPRSTVFFNTTLPWDVLFCLRDFVHLVHGLLVEPKRMSSMAVS